MAATNDPEEQRLLALHYVTVFTDNNGGIALINFEAETEDRLGSPICPHHVKVWTIFFFQEMFYHFFCAVWRAFEQKTGMNDEALGMMVASMVRGQSLCAVHFIGRIVHLLPPRHIRQTLDVNEGLIQRKLGCCCCCGCWSLHSNDGKFVFNGVLVSNVKCFFIVTSFFSRLTQLSILIKTEGRKEKYRKTKIR